MKWYKVIIEKESESKRKIWDKHLQTLGGNVPPTGIGANDKIVITNVAPPGSKRWKVK